MKINLCPIRRDDTLTLSRSGDTLTINGEIFDFSAIPDGATLPRAAVDCDWLASDVERVNGVLTLTVILPHGPNAPEETRFPEPLTLTTDGPIALPAYDAEETAE